MDPGPSPDTAEARLRYRTNGFPINAIVKSAARRYVTTFEGFDAPWSHLAAEIPGLRVHRLFLGGAYLAIGVIEIRPS